ncbi:MAG: glycosyltransferase [Acidimicrobiia bacterium]
MRKLLVVSSVHPPDDPRIRHKLIRTLAAEWSIVYATRTPGPTDASGLTWSALRGPRIVRSVRASWLLVRGSFDLASVHDPELLPAALLAALLRRRIVYDVHEDLPAQLIRRPGLPRVVRRLLAGGASTMLRFAERMLPLTLAEPGYTGSFRKEHPVFPNLLEPFSWPERTGSGVGIVYLGDVTEARGAMDLVDAVARMPDPPRLHLIGRCREALRADLAARASSSGVDLRLHGYLDRVEAMDIVAGGRVGVSPLRDTPNYRHSLPTKILEYLALGVPVVASDLPGTRAVAADLPGVALVPPGDVGALAAAITEAAGRGDQAEAAAGNAADIRDQYRWPHADVVEFYGSSLD